MERKHIAILITLVAVVGLLMAGGAIADGSAGTQDNVGGCTESIDSGVGSQDYDDGKESSDPDTPTDTASDGC